MWYTVPRPRAYIHDKINSFKGKKLCIFKTMSQVFLWGNIQQDVAELTVAHTKEISMRDCIYRHSRWLLHKTIFCFLSQTLTIIFSFNSNLCAIIVHQQ